MLFNVCNLYPFFYNYSFTTLVQVLFIIISYYFFIFMVSLSGLPSRGCPQREHVASSWCARDHGISFAPGQIWVPAVTILKM